MREEEKRDILQTVEFESKNGVKLTAEEYISLDGYEEGRRHYYIYKTEKGFNDGYVFSCDNGIGKMYSLSIGEVESFKSVLDIFKNRNILHRLGTAMRDGKNGYSIDLYSGCDIENEEFDQLIKDIEFLLKEKCRLHYNDEHGVGYFEKSRGKGKYKATHHRYCTERNETLDMAGIRSFLREFFDIGYSYTQNDDWS